jgi:hypothetical protein
MQNLREKKWGRQTFVRTAENGLILLNFLRRERTGW